MIDVTAQISAVERLVGSRSLAVGEARTVTISQSYRAGIEELWDACTTPERLVRWFLPVSGDLRVGGRYQIQGNASGTIERCDPPKGFAASWEYGGDVTWIEVRLTPGPDGQTLLEVEHTVPAHDAKWAEFGPGALGVGWDMILMGLATHLRSGQSVDPAESAAWTISEDGRRFMTVSSDRWYEANLAAGADEVTARAAAARTIAAYTGRPS
jgi:uncharacterized protein YndB with AHSA1/START domain